MVKSGRKKGKPDKTASRRGVRRPRPGVSKSEKDGSRKPRSTITAPRRHSSLRSENARLKSQLETARLQQEASAEILRAVANAAGDAAGPLQLIAETTARLFGAASVSIQLAEGSEFTQEYRVGAIAKRIGSAYPRSNIKVGGRNLPGTVVAESRQIHIADLDHLDPSMSDFPGLPHARAGGARTVCGTPLRREGKAIGALIVFRDRLAPFTADELALQQTFADQAVIAIENARLFNETRETLERQTATSDILRMINQSPSDVAPVFDAIAERARVLCGALLGATTRFDGKLLHLVGYHGVSPQAEAVMRSSFPREPDLSSINGRCILAKGPVQIADIEVDPHYQLTAAAKAADYRALLAVPMLQGADVIGVIAVTRKEPGEFPAKLIELLQTFAEQAVIAVENARLFDEVQARTSDLQESLRQQTATADVLQIISNSPGELQPVFKAVLENATRICDAPFGTLLRFDGSAFYFAADIGTPPALAEYMRRPGPFQGPPGGMIDRIQRTRQVQHTPDYAADAVPGLAAKLGGARSTLGVPILRDEMLVGAIVIYRQEVRPFTTREIDLVRSFAAQAAIAIENARLFNETKETLQHQIASADVLQVVGKSMADAQPVFERIVDSLERLIPHKHIAIFLTPGDGMLHLVARRGPRADDLDPIYPAPIERTAVPAVTKSLRQLYFPDVLHGRDVPESMRSVARANGNYSDVLTPLLWEGRLVGMIAVTREPNVAFSERELALLRTFADQAVIAIENARLFKETKLALERQTATAEILKVIASSPGDVQPVFDAIASSARRLIGGFSTAVHLVIDDVVHLVAFTPTNPEADAILVAAHPRHRSEVAAVALVENGEIAQIADSETADAHTRELGRARGWRSLTLTPLMNQDKFIGFIASTRRETGVLGDHHVELLRTFADQAVIAIENARLFDEVQAKTRDLSEALTYQTGSANILNVIASSPTDVAPVLKAIVESACEVCEAYDAAVLLRDGDDLRFSAHHGPIPIGLEKLPINRRWTAGRAFIDQAPVHIEDLRDDRHADFSDGRDLSLRMGHRTIVSVPLLRDRESIGAIVLRRIEVNPFSDKQIALLQTFADQAVIALGNVRLFEEVQAKTRELERSLDDLRAAQDRLVQTEKLASLGQLTAGIAHEIKNPLNFVNNFSALSAELTDELNDLLKGANFSEDMSKEVDELTSLLKDNLGKVVQHGKRADSIVKNMLLHSREGSGEHRPSDVNALVEESLNLAYHGARAEKSHFDVTIERDLDLKAGTIEVFPQEITRVLLNLISNGFYAVSKRKAEHGNTGFTPVVKAITRGLPRHVEIRIRDNGTGIPPEVKEKMFNPFFTTKPAGEGTGLGLSMSHDIVVKQHGGTIDVETVPGEFTEFTIRLPRTSDFKVSSRGQA